MKLKLSNAALLLALLLGVKIPEHVVAMPVSQTDSAIITGRVALEAPMGRMAQMEITGSEYNASLEDHPGAELVFLTPAEGQYQLLATAACHLPALLTDVTASPDPYTVLLPAGDVDGDGIIASSDLAYIGSRYGTTGEFGCANLDGDRDGKVNILDLQIVARNYGLAGDTGLKD